MTVEIIYAFTDCECRFLHSRKRKTKESVMPQSKPEVVAECQASPMLAMAAAVPETMHATGLHRILDWVLHHVDGAEDIARVTAAVNDAMGAGISILSIIKVLAPFILAFF